jgi:ABC-type Zn uptake system ZnuABC Zn-binding protein ZnuA
MTTLTVRSTWTAVLLIGVLIWLLVGLGGCEQPQQPRAPGGSVTPEIAAASYPVAYLSRRISGEVLPVFFPEDVVSDPAAWLPSREQIQRYQRAALLVVNGAGLERWTGVTSLPRSRMLDSSAEFRERWLELTGVVRHTHGQAGEHEHRGPDGHTWLDPDLARAQARAIERRAAEVFPEHAQALAQGLASLEQELSELDAIVERLAPAAAGLRLGCDAPSYAYLARRLGCQIVPGDHGPVVLRDAPPPSAADAVDGVVWWPSFAGGPETSADLLASFRRSMADLEAELAAVNGAE